MNDGVDTLDTVGRNHDRHPIGAGLYVDVENLQKHGQQLITTLLHDWPEFVPTPCRLVLYVQANSVELWRLWATSQFQRLEVVVKGVQHFSGNSSKNSADIAIATNAIADLILGRISYVAVLSDDSDFASLYVNIRDELNQSNVPFLWVMTDRQKSISPIAKQFFPSDKLYVVAVDREQTDATSPSKEERSHPTTAHTSATNGLWNDMAQAIVKAIPIGAFKSTDCRNVIKEGWPDHPLSRSNEPAFGIEFKKNIWPVLESMGVKIPNPSRKPIRYEMTNKAKKSSR